MPRLPRRLFPLPGWPTFRWWLAAVLIQASLPVSLAYVNGDRVQASQNANVRTAPAGTVLGQRVIGDTGAITGGPVTAALSGGSSYVWWQVDWDTGVDGWSFDNGLASADVGNQDIVYGIDVSRWQASINWPAVYAEGKRFAFCKASEATDYVDPYFTANASGGRAAGMIMGMYHFSRPLNNPALAEARHFVQTAAPWLIQGNLLPVLDLESGDGLGKTQLSAWVRDWCAEVQRLTLLRPIIYMNRNYARNYLTADLAAYPLWIAVPGFTPGSNVVDLGPWPDWAFQQYSWTGRLSGIGNSTVDTDLNAFRGTTADLAPYQIPAISQSIASATVTPAPAVRGTTVTFTIATNGTHGRQVLLGATLFPAGTANAGISDAAHEGPFTLTAGTGTLTRSFILPPTMAGGSQDLWLRLYADVNANGKIDSGEMALSPVFKKPNALTVTETPDFSTWAALSGLPAEQTGTTADPDGDGADNLLEYAFASAPGSPTSLPLTFLSRLPDGRLEFSFDRLLNRADLTWIIQYSAGLTEWTTLAAATGDAPFSTEGVTQSGTNPVHVRVVMDPASVSAGFLRVKVQRN